MKKYRNNGAIGALLDEYEKAVIELQTIISDLSESELVKIVDPGTKDPDCRSVQTILTHVVCSGYCYVIEIRNWLGEKLSYVDRQKLNTVEEYIHALDQVFEFNEQLFIDYPDMKLHEFSCNKKIKVKWGQHYDPEQILEHAIVHILRHRRQIERFKLRMSA